MVGIIITGVDGSETALQAAKKAASLAVALESELHVVSAFEVSLAGTFGSLQGRSESDEFDHAYRVVRRHHSAEAKRTASRVADVLRAEHPDVTIIPAAVEGSAGTVLNKEAERLGADLIVVGNKRVQGLGRILGSVARTVASEAKSDVYIVNTHQR